MKAGRLRNELIRIGQFRSGGPPMVDPLGFALAMGNALAFTRRGLDWDSFAEAAGQAFLNFEERHIAMVMTAPATSRRLLDPQEVGRLIGADLEEILTCEGQDRSWRPLPILMVAPADETPAERRTRLRQLKRKRDRDSIRHSRRRAGVKARSAYEAESDSRQKPWEKLGISRRTYYRRKASSAGTNDTPVPCGTSLSLPNSKESAERRTCANAGYLARRQAGAERSEGDPRGALRPVPTQEKGVRK
jgi:hypothetical protein